MKNIDPGVATDIKKSLTQEAAKRGADVTWFKYAEKSANDAWNFLPKREIQIEVLKQITKHVSRKYPNFTSGQIADYITHIVNS